MTSQLRPRRKETMMMIQRIKHLMNRSRKVKRKSRLKREKKSTIHAQSTKLVREQAHFPLQAIQPIM